MINMKYLAYRQEYMCLDVIAYFGLKVGKNKVEETLKEIRGKIAKELEEDDFSKTLETYAGEFFTTCETDKLIEKLEKYGNIKGLNEEFQEKYKNILKKSLKFDSFVFAKCNMVSYARILFYQCLQIIKEVSNGNN